MQGRDLYMKVIISFDETVDFMAKGTHLYFIINCLGTIITVHVYWLAKRASVLFFHLPNLIKMWRILIICKLLPKCHRFILVQIRNLCIFLSQEYFVCPIQLVKKLCEKKLCLISQERSATALYMQIQLGVKCFISSFLELTMNSGCVKAV